MTHLEKRQRRAAIAADIKGGMTPQNAAIKYDVGISVIRDSCWEHGISIKRKAKNGIS